MGTFITNSRNLSGGDTRNILGRLGTTTDYGSLPEKGHDIMKMISFSKLSNISHCLFNAEVSNRVFIPTEY